MSSHNTHRTMNRVLSILVVLMLLAATLASTSTARAADEETATPVSAETTPEPTLGPTTPEQPATATSTETASAEATTIATGTPTVETPTPEPTATAPPVASVTDEPTVTAILSPSPTPNLTPTVAATKPVVAAAIGTLRIRSWDAIDQLLPDACYAIYADGGSGSLGTHIADLCDTDHDGYIAQQLSYGSYVLVETARLPGFGLALNRTFAITRSTQMTVTIRHAVLTSIVVSTTDKHSGDPATGGCIAIQVIDIVLPLDPGYAHCDADDGTIDGQIHIPGIDRGSYQIIDWSPPEGYLSTPNTVPVVVTSLSSPEKVTFYYDRGGSILIHKRNEIGAPLAGACFRVSLPDEHGNPTFNTIASGCDAPWNETGDGDILIQGLQTGSYVLEETTTPAGYVAVPFQTVNVTAGETLEMTIADPLGGHLILHVVDGNSNPVPGACFDGYRDGGGGTPGVYLRSFCDSWDGVEDGTVNVIGLPAGSIFLREVIPPRYYAGTPDFTFTIAIAETKEMTVENLPFATVNIDVMDQHDVLVPGACFWAFEDTGTEYTGPLVTPTTCDDADGANDGHVTLRIPAGKVVLQERFAASGHVGAEDMKLTLTAGQLLGITIVNKVPTTLVIRTVDVNGDRVDNAYIHIVQTVGGTYDLEEWTNGELRISSIAAGTYAITPGPPYQDHNGFIAPDPVEVTIAEWETVEVVFVYHQPAPQITINPLVNDISATTFSVYFVTDQKSAGRVEFGTTQALGQTAPASPETATDKHRLLVSGLKSDTVYYFRVSAENGNGVATSSMHWARTASSSATASVIVHKVNSATTPIHGACFDIYVDAGGGTLGDFVTDSCDAFDLDGNNGSITLSGLKAGNYVLVESLAPKGYALAAYVRFTLAKREVKELTVTDRGGGHRLAVSAVDDHGKAVLGACFAVYVYEVDKPVGNYLAYFCDGWDGLDGHTMLSGFKVGTYYIYETWVPKGYTREGWTTFRIVSYHETEYIDYHNYTPDYANSVVAIASDANQTPVLDACFLLYENSGGHPGHLVERKCDGWDGWSDGNTNFLNVYEGSYILIESSAPDGYQLGGRISFTKNQERQKKVRFTQTPSDISLKIVTRKGSSSSVLPGACYALFRQVGKAWEVLTVGCDSWDGKADGILIFSGLPAGTFRLIQATTPAGYVRPAEITITMGSKSRVVSVRTSPK